MLGPIGQTTPFVMPSSCPTSLDKSCFTLIEWHPISAEEEEDIDVEKDELMEEDLDQQEEMSEKNRVTSQLLSPQKSTRAKKSKTCLVETEIRRCTRLKIRNKGFKTSSCGKVNCLGYSSRPPPCQPQSSEI